MLKKFFDWIIYELILGWHYEPEYMNDIWDERYRDENEKFISKKDKETRIEW